MNGADRKPTLLRGLLRAFLNEAITLAVVAAYGILYMTLVPDSIGLTWKLLGLFVGCVIGLVAYFLWRDRKRVP